MPSRRARKTPAFWMVIFTLLIAGFMSYAFFTGSSMTERYAPLVDAAMEIKLEATIGHLWLEEIIGGDRSLEITDVFKHLEQSEWYARAMLEGGENQESKFVPLDSPALRSKIEKTLEGIISFKAVAWERWNARSKSGIGSDIDQRFDLIFDEFMRSADDVETVLQQEMGQQLQRFNTLEILLIAFILIMGAFLTIVLYRHEQRRIGDMLALQDKEKNLRQLRNYLVNIIDSMPSALVGVDSAGKVTQWNHAAEQTAGVKVEDALGQPLAQVFPRMIVEMERLNRAIKTRQQQSDPRHSYQRDGETRIEEVTIYPLIANGVEGAVIRLDDITERIRTEEMMVQSEKMLSVGGLAAGMAHEINNPLAGIMQTTDVLLRRLIGDIPANQRAAQEAGTSMATIGAFMEAREIPKMLGRIRTSGDRAAEIVSNMLSFARKSDNVRSSHDLARLLDRCVDLAGSDYNLKKKYDFRQIEIVREYEDNLPPVPCETGTIQQVMLNLLRNGAEAIWESNGRKPLLTLRVENEPAAGMVRIEVEDNGPGIEEDICKRIFEPFFTTKPVGLGTGLGLSVSYFIVTENHGGEMSVESQPGQGTKFIVRLPVGGPKKKMSPFMPDLQTTQ